MCQHLTFITVCPNLPLSQRREKISEQSEEYYQRDQVLQLQLHLHGEQGRPGGERGGGEGRGDRGAHLLPPRPLHVRSSSA